MDVTVDNTVIEVQIEQKVATVEVSQSVTTVQVAGVGTKGDVGDTGVSPEHRWSGTELQFTNPDGTWGTPVDLAPVGLVSSARRLELEATAGEVISALKLVYFDGVNVFVGDKGSYGTSKLLGVAVNAGGVGDIIKVHLMGQISDPSFNYTLNAPLFLNSNGTITEVPPTVGFSCRVGFSLGPGRIFVRIDEPIQL